jgi:hypothetical protein
MKAMNVTSSVTKIADAGHRDLLHIYNNSNEVIYLQYDGSDPSSLTTANGMPLLPGAMLPLENNGTRQIFNKAVYAIHGGTGNKEVRLQGE